MEFTLNQIHTIFTSHTVAKKEHVGIVSKAIRDLSKKIDAEKQAVYKEKFLTQKELSERWRIADYTLRSWRKEGKGPACINLGGCKYRMSDILEYEKQNLIKQ